MNENSSVNHTRYLLSTGIILGFLLLVGGTLLTLSHNNLPFNFTGLSILHHKIPAFYIFDLLPVILGFSAYFIGININNKNVELEEKLAKEKQQSQRILEFTDKLINDHLEADYNLQNENDLLGKSLINLRDNLKKNNLIEEKRRKEDDQRNWIAEGLARFSEILRNDNNDIQKLSFSIINHLVKYLNANQGGFFILHDEGEKIF